MPPAFKKFRKVFHARRGIVMQKLRQRKLFEFLRGVAEHFKYGAVGIGRPVAKDHDDPFRRGLDQLAVLLLGSEEELLGLAPGPLYAKALLINVKQDHGYYARYKEREFDKAALKARDLLAHVLYIDPRAYNPAPGREKAHVRELRDYAAGLVLPLPHVVDVAGPVAAAYLREFGEHALAVRITEVGKVFPVQVGPVGMHDHLRAEVRYPEIILAFRPVAQAAEALHGFFLRLAPRQEPGFLVAVEFQEQAVRGIVQFPYSLPLAVHHVPLEGRDYEQESGGYEQNDGKSAGQDYAGGKTGAIRLKLRIHR